MNLFKQSVLKVSGIVFHTELRSTEKFCRIMAALEKKSNDSRFVKHVCIWSFSGLYFPALGLNTGRYSVSSVIQSSCKKNGPEKLRIRPFFMQCLSECTIHAFNDHWRNLLSKQVSLFIVLINFQSWRLKFAICLQHVYTVYAWVLFYFCWGIIL